MISVVKLVSNGHHETSNLVPRPPPFCSLVWVQHNTRMQKSSEKWGRPGNEARKFIERVFAICCYIVHCTCSSALETGKNSLVHTVCACSVPQDFWKSL